MYSIEGKSRALVTIYHGVEYPSTSKTNTRTAASGPLTAHRQSTDLQRNLRSCPYAHACPFIHRAFHFVCFLGAGSYSYANWLGPIDAVVVLVGIGTAFYFKRYRPAKYEQAGRLINEGL